MLAIVVAVILLTGTLAWLVLEVRASGELVTPWSLILVMAAADIFAPGVMFLANGLPPQPWWIKPLTTDAILNALLTFAAMMLLMRVGYWFATRPRRETAAPIPATRFELNVLAAYILVIGSAAAYLVFLGGEVAQAGSIEQYISQRLRSRWVPEPVESGSPWEFLVHVVVGPASMTLFFLVTIVLFFFRWRLRRPFLFGFVLPVMAWGFSITTFYRGTQVVLCLAFLIVEVLRLRTDTGEPETPEEKQARSTKQRRRRLAAVGLLAAGGILYNAYGATRQYMTDRDQTFSANAGEAGSLQVEDMLSGHGLVGLASIVDLYPDRYGFLNGRTIVDMLLLPVPRLIYPSKPQWYGIDDITRGMGWPPSTQSAVTIPGELYANFGFPGLLLAPLYGLFFGTFFRQRMSPRLRFLYASNMPAMVMVSHWMAFTGFVNTFMTLVLQFVVLTILVRPVAGVVELGRVRGPASNGLPSESGAST